MRKKDIVLNALTIIFSSIGVLILAAISIYIFSNGFKTLNLKLITSDYYSETYTVKYTDNIDQTFSKPNNVSGEFSKTFGIAIKRTTNINNEEVIEIVYIDKASPFNSLMMEDGKTMNAKVGYEIEKIMLEDSQKNIIVATSNDLESEFIAKLEKGVTIYDMTLNYGGGGIRGSLIATVYLILLTLVISIPIGVVASFYFCVYSKPNKLNRVMNYMIDLTSGIPSIIFGLVGALLFIPFVSKITSNNTGSIITGALTLSIMLLPIIIRNTSDSIKNIDPLLIQASLALGATKTQTVFRVILPNCVSGILTAIILSIGKIIGESAALIYAIGTAIKDKIILSDKATTLSTHIWVLMSGDEPNFEVSCSIAIIILIVVVTFSVLIKLISKKYTKEA